MSTSAAVNGATTDDVVDRRLQIAIGVVCLIGIGVATYLTYTHYA